MDVPLLKMKSGHVIPQLGFGTWKSKPEDVTQAVMDAIDVGFRHVDCAHVYGNEPAVGEGLRKKITEGVIQRQDMFITSKLWNTFHDPLLVENACRQSLNDLGVDYLDLYLIHWPVGHQAGADLFPRNPAGMSIPSNVDYVDTWHSMEQLVAMGLCRSIGLSNFNRGQIERLLQSATIKPAVNQVECHAYLTQYKLSQYCASQDIVFTAYSPLGSPDRPRATPQDPVLLNDPVLRLIGERYNKSPAQVLIRYQLQRGHAVIPKSVTKSRIAENMDVFDFKLNGADLKEVDGLNRDLRFCQNPSSRGHKYHPFENDEY